MVRPLAPHPRRNKPVPPLRAAPRRRPVRPLNGLLKFVELDLDSVELMSDFRGDILAQGRRPTHNPSFQYENRQPGDSKFEWIAAPAANPQDVSDS